MSTSAKTTFVCSWCGMPTDRSEHECAPFFYFYSCSCDVWIFDTSKKIIALERELRLLLWVQYSKITVKSTRNSTFVMNMLKITQKLINKSNDYYYPNPNLEHPTNCTLISNNLRRRLGSHFTLCLLVKSRYCIFTMWFFLHNMNVPYVLLVKSRPPVNFSRNVHNELYSRRLNVILMATPKGNGNLE